MRENLGAIVFVALFASAIQAGEIKVHHWPSAFIPQEIPACEIPVLMDVDAFPLCSILVTPVHLEQVDFRTYEGCSRLVVACDRNVTLTCSVVPNGLVGGKYSAFFSDPDIEAPGGSTTLCVKLTEAVVGNLVARKRLRVATVKITIAER